jgi:DNA-binding protein YbaB
MFGGLGDLAKMMQQAKEIKKNVEEMKKTLAESEFSGVSANAKVIAVVSGDFQLKRVEFKDGNVAENDVFEAVNTALNTARNEAQSKLQEIAGPLNVPGLF